jgi:hypothetical protein
MPRCRIEISERLYGRIKKLSDQLDLTLTETLARAVENFEQFVFMEKVLSDFENLKLKSGDFVEYVNGPE